MQPDLVPAWSRQLFREIAKPRLAGSKEVASVEDLIVRQLERFGFNVERQPFRTSPKRLHAGSVLGAGLGWVALVLIPLFFFPISGWIVATIGTASFAVVGLVAAGIANGALPLNVPTVEAHNLIASRTPAPMIWLVAHSDSKTQSISLKGRIIVSVLSVAGLVGVFIVLGARLFVPVPVIVASVPLLGLLVGAAGLSRPALRGGSPGAVDNASGVIAALHAAELLSDRQDVGVLITGAEEFGMEGARAWIARGDCSGSFINFDGVDTTGLFNIMRHRASGSGGGGSQRLHDAVCRVLTERGLGVRSRALPFGVFVDGSIIAKGGLPGLTISRGTWKTLAVVHTMKDTADRTDPVGAVLAGAAVADAVRTELG